MKTTFFTLIVSICIVSIPTYSHAAEDCPTVAETANLKLTEQIEASDCRHTKLTSEMLAALEKYSNAVFEYENPEQLKQAEQKFIDLNSQLTAETQYIIDLILNSD